MGALADILIEVLVMESAILRAEKCRAAHPIAVPLAQLTAARSFRIVTSAAERILGAVAEGDMLRTQMAIFRRLTKHEPANTVALGRSRRRAHACRRALHAVIRNFPSSASTSALPLVIQPGPMMLAAGALVPVIGVPVFAFFAMQIGMHRHAFAALQRIDQPCARDQSPFASHHSAASGGESSCGGSFAASVA